MHAGFLLWMAAELVPLAKLAPLQKLALGVGLPALLLLELALLSLLNAALELAAGRRLGRWILDGGKALAVTLTVVWFAASVRKFVVTGVHLKRSDLWFAYSSFRQLLQEAQAGEVLALVSVTLAVPVGTLLLAVALVACRRRSPGRALTLLVVLALPAAAALGWSLTTPTARRFVTLTPEGHWLSRAWSGALAPVQRLDAAGELAAASLGAPITPYRPAAAARRDNVVLVMLESLPWKRTSFAGDPQSVTPHLDRLAAESLLFSRAYTTSTHSDYAQMSILSSLHPRKFDRHDFYSRLDYPRTLIWDALRRAGYATSMFSCQNERWGNMLAYLDTPGLEVLRHSPDWPRARHRGRGAESKVYEETPVEEWMRWREERAREPYFTYLNFQASHFDYRIPPEAPRRFTPWQIDFPASFFRYPRQRVPTMLNRFYNSLTYTDSQLGRVVDFLAARGELDRTALVVVSDHGEAFYEHGQPTHGSALFEEQVRSLLLMRLPGRPPRRIDEPVSLLDLAPALLAHLGLPPHGNFQGRGDVLAPDYRAAGRPFFFTIQGVTAEDGLLLDDAKYTVNWDRRERRLYDLAADPEERIDLLATSRESADRLDAVLRGFLARQTLYYDRKLWRAGRYVAPLP